MENEGMGTAPRCYKIGLSGAPLRLRKLCGPYLSFTPAIEAANVAIVVSKFLCS